MSKRTEQLGHEIQRVLGEIIQYELKDPRVGFATVVGVDVTADLQIARVRISVMGTPEERRETMAALEHAKGFLRRRLAEELNYLRYVPELRLILDTSVDYSLHIDEVLRRAAAERTSAPPRQPDDDKPAKE
ncbi:MAG: 30S ribosome-binding factor RbfA [Roseiflexus sp.]|nr:30S ribosome-binding factor RbfA [Roseiflexus sp.]MCS7289425.1 30S ribosome-binding factor RbfA [Roseiflexus sp.]MDW8144891.1 30S ribosome-binding factor RbfA [Roseiflexaceae bacterium]MDW8233914.1 30S ribosome-binding factor RbfA [Roseiflexaceae bacterium]